jgi:hypothetical protein
MKYTPRQLSFAQHLLRRLGFFQQKDIDVYLQHLLQVRGRYQYNPKVKNPFKRWQYSAKACIDALLTEVELKKKPQQIQIRPQLGRSFSASSLARYGFCPAAMSIADSFESAETQSSEAIEMGNSLHESLRLSGQRRKCTESTDPFYRRAWQNPAIGKMLRAETVFCGHTEMPKLFYNEETGFVGSPDYIFKDRAGSFFVVEEKFIRCDDPMNPPEHKLAKEAFKGTLKEKNLERQQQWEKLAFYFFDNHILQVLAYLYNLVEYPLQYGYLVYWLYDFKDGEPYVHKAGVKKISLDADNRTLYHQNLSKMQQLKEQGTESFDPQNVNVKKCAACSFNAYCMHKTRRLNTLHYPYRSNDLRLFAAAFPGMLCHQI